MLSLCQCIYITSLPVKPQSKCVYVHLTLKCVCACVCESYRDISYYKASVLNVQAEHAARKGLFIRAKLGKKGVGKQKKRENRLK